MTAASRPGRKQVLGRLAAGGYVAVAVALAVTGGITQTPLPYLLDVAWTLPVGVVAFISVYAGYAALVGVGTVLGLATDTPDSGGSFPLWLALSSSAFDTIAFAAAAVLNLLVLSRYLRARRARRAAEPAG